MTNSLPVGEKIAIFQTIKYPTDLKKNEEPLFLLTEICPNILIK